MRTFENVCARARPVVRFQTDIIIIVINKNVRRTATTKVFVALGGGDRGVPDATDITSKRYLYN